MIFLLTTLYECGCLFLRKKLHSETVVSRKMTGTSEVLLEAIASAKVS